MSDFLTTYRVAKSFRLGSRTYSKGEIVRADDPISERVNRERPDLFLITVERAGLASRRHENVAGTRSSHERQPMRDWLAASK
jgi:hypothetical protein